MKSKEKNKQKIVHESIPVSEQSEDDVSGSEMNSFWVEKAGSGPPSLSDNDNIAASRIARTGQKVLAEAVRLFSRAPFPQKKRIPSGEEWGWSAGMAASFSDQEKASLIEVTDRNDRPLLCMVPEAVISQNLRYRLIAVALRTRKNRIVLHKGRDKRLGYAQCWDLYTGFVFVGEAREDAAQRLLAAKTLSGIRLQLIGVSDSRTGNGPQCSFFSGELPSGLYPAPIDAEDEAGPHSSLFMEVEKKETLLELDSDELMGLVERGPELFSPELLWAAEAGVLFHKKKFKFS